MSEDQQIQGTERGRKQTIGILNGLIGRLQEKREEFAGGAVPTPRAFLEVLST